MPIAISRNAWFPSMTPCRTTFAPFSSTPRRRADFSSRWPVPMRRACSKPQSSRHPCVEIGEVQPPEKPTIRIVP